MPSTPNRKDHMKIAQMLVPYDSARSLLGGIGKTTLYTLIEAGEIQRVKIGNRAFVTTESITECVERLTAAPGSFTHAAA
jgi:hypothetical protein